MSFQLLREITSSVWALEPNSIANYLPMVNRLIMGEKVDLSYMVSQQENQDETISATSTDKRVAVISIHDVITKYDYCGDAGLITIEQALKSMYQNDSIGAIILDMDTPGGSASYLPTFVNTLRSRTKPVYAYVSGMAASAGYYIASNTDAIFLSNPMDQVGSIGTMVSFMTREHSKESGIKEHVIYATKSVDKNKIWSEAVNGNYKLLIDEVLDPFNDQFHKDVKLGRPSIDESTLTGKMYYPEKAEKLGMIDGIKTFDEVVEFAIQSINNPDMKWQNLFNKNKTPKMSKKNEKIEAIIGREITTDAPITAEELELVEKSVSSQSEEEEEEPTPAPALTSESIASIVSATVTPMLATVTESIAKQAESITAINKRLDATTAKPADVGNDADKDTQEKDAWDREDDPIAQKVKADLDALMG